MNPGKVSSVDIRHQIERLHADGAASECHYISLLQVLLFPHIYWAEDSDLPLILSALRESEAKPGAFKLSVILNRLLSPNPNFDDLQS